MTSTTAATAMLRIFKYDGKIIINKEQDPGTEYSPQMILDHLKSTGVYPELGKAEIEIREKTLKDGTLQIEFVKKAGTKG